MEKQIQETAVYCPNCGALIGFVLNVNGQAWLQVGGFHIKYGYGRCGVCRKIFQFKEKTSRITKADNFIMVINSTENTSQNP